MTLVLQAIAKRGVQILIVALVVTLGTAVLLRVVPGDAAQTLLGTRATPEALSAVRHLLGLDKPLLDQVATSFGHLFEGNLGTSFSQRGRAVSEIVWAGLGVTASIVLATILWSVMIGIPAGLWLALTPTSAIDLVGRVALTICVALPTFVAGLVLLFAVALRLGLAPAGGWAGSWPANIEYLWLPAAALTLYLGPLIARVVRQTALETIGQPFVEAARSRGLPRSRIVVKHVLPNTLLPVITLVGFNAGVLISSTVTVEVVFGLPGIGSSLLQAMQARDLPVVQGIALVTAVFIVLFNLLADLVNVIIDPRLRRRG